MINHQLPHRHPVLFRWGSKWQQGNVIGQYELPKEGPVVKVLKDGLEHTVRADEAETFDEHERKAAAERLAADQAEYQPEIDAWNAGAKTPKLMAEALKKNPLAAGNRLRAAMRRGLLK